MSATPAPDPLAVRRTSRVLLIDPQGRVLLFQDTDVGAPRRRFWITPGGGIEPGETPRQAALRELAEETGRVLADHELRGPVAERTVTLHFTDRVKHHHDTFFVASTAPFDVVTDGWTVLERDTLLGYRWWDPDNLAQTSEVIWPGSLGSILAAVTDERRWPLHFDDGDEFTG